MHKPVLYISLYISLTLALLVSSVGAYAAGPDIQYWKTKSNVPVYFVSLPSLPMVDIKIILKAGSIHDGARPGLANMTMALLRSGTDTMDVLALNKAMDRTGASMGFSASHARMNGTLRSLTTPKQLNAALALFLQILSSPSFPEDEVELIRKRTLQSIRTQNEKPGSILGRTFGETLYANHIYSQPVIGYENSVEKITRQDLRKFYETYFVRSNLMIVGGGDLSKDEFSVIAERIANALPQGSPASAIEAFTMAKKSTRVSVAFPSEQTHVKIGQTTMNVYNPDRFAMYLGNHILGGSGFGSRLVEEVRVKNGFAYSVGSRNNSGLITGVFSMSFQTRSDQVDKAMTVTMDTLRDFVENGPTEEEVKQAFENIKNKFAYRMISNGSIVGAMAWIANFNLELDYFDTYLDHFKNLDAKQVHAVFKKYIEPDKFITVVVGQTENISKSSQNKQ